MANCLSLNRHSERGASLVALMALMTIMGLLMLAAAPSLWMDMQRAKEEEAIARGEEVQEAILIFLANTGRLPKSIDELLEGVPVPGRTKKRMVLRASAAVDPLSASGEWKLIQPGNNKVLGEFQRKLASYTGSNTFSNPVITGNYASAANAVLNAAAGAAIRMLDTETSEETDPPGGDDESDNIDAPFIAVVSRSQRKSVINYYGIERHDRWVFTPLFRGAGNQGGIP